MAHVGPVCHHDEQRTEADIIRRADFDEVEAFEDRLDFDQEVIFRAIRDLRYWLKFEQERLPLRRAE